MKTLIFASLVKLLLSFILLASPLVNAKNYLSKDDFINRVITRIQFNNKHDEVKFNKQAVWLKGDIKENIKQLIGHAYPKIRLTYHWAIINHQLVTIWFLDEIGKERPISFAFWIQQDQVKQVSVLTFRESRGGEITMPAFEQQFSNNSLNSQDQFTQPIDGITGATLSVRAMKKMTRLALYLHHWVEQKREKS